LTRENAFASQTLSLNVYFILEKSKWMNHSEAACVFNGLFLTSTGMISMNSHFVHDRRAKVLALLLVIACAVLANGCGKSQLHTGYSDARVSERPTQSSPRGIAARPFPSAHTTAVAECPVPPDPVSHRTITHEVAPLETIWRLSRMYDVSEESIYLANNLKPGETIHIGQKLLIPHARPLRHVISLYPNERWQYIILHHTASDIGKALLINNYHHDRGFWNGLGYHFVIGNGTLGKLDGQIEVSPRWIKQLQGAHCKAGGMNEKSIGIALVGNFNEDLPTQAQLDSLSYLLKLLTDYYRIPPSRVMGHGDVQGARTDCPGTRFPWPVIRQCLAR